MCRSSEYYWHLYDINSSNLWTEGVLLFTGVIFKFISTTLCILSVKPTYLVKFTSMFFIPIDSIANTIIFLILFLDFLLLVYRSVTDLSVLIMYLVILQILLLSEIVFVYIKYLEYFTFKVMYFKVRSF